MNSPGVVNSKKQYDVVLPRTDFCSLTTLAPTDNNACFWALTIIVSRCRDLFFWSVCMHILTWSVLTGGSRKYNPGMIFVLPAAVLICRKTPRARMQAGRQVRDVTRWRGPGAWYLLADAGRRSSVADSAHTRKHLHSTSKDTDRQTDNRMGGIQQQPWTPTKRRGPIAAEYSSPGPACVSLPNLIGGSAGPDSKRGRAPAFSFGSRHGNKNDSPGPGPGQYNVTGLSARGKDSPPAATLHSRPKEMKSDQTPAPGDYNPEKSEKVVHDNSPKYTFGLKTQVEKPSSTPGPGTYNDAKADNYKARSPAYSVSSRYQLPSDSTQKPGPGAYSPEKIKMDNLPAHSFGIKHSPYIGYLKAHVH